MIMAREISSGDDIIDSRDVIERIDELTNQKVAYDDGEDDATWDDDDQRELITLEDLARQGETVGDWIYGATLIRESYFVQYAKDYAEDVIDGASEVRWPFTHIHWEAAATDLRTDYTEIEFAGVTYLVR